MGYAELIERLQALPQDEHADWADGEFARMAMGQVLLDIEDDPRRVYRQRPAGTLAVKPIERNVTKQAERDAISDDRLGNALAMLDALNLPPLTDEDIDTEITAVRQERATQRSILHTNF